MKIRILIYSVILFLVLVVFRIWFLFFPLSAGDWSYNFSETIRSFYVFPSVWNTYFNNGLGQSIAFILPLETYFLASVYILNRILGLPWVLIERIISFWPFILITCLSSAYLYKKIFNENKFWIFSSLIFLFNTYALVLVGGGQMGVAMGYALAPLVLYFFINELTDLRVNELNKNIVIAGLGLALQVVFDARIAYVTMVAVGIYFILRLPRQPFRFFLVMTGPITIAVLLHFFWLLPLVLIGQNPIAQLGPAYNSSAAVKFLSFADFSHTLSFLHPNWPENIFGKVYFLQPEFILLPILAYSSLLFVSISILNPPTGGHNSKLQFKIQKFKNNLTREQSNNKTIIFFALLGLVGAFLAKGANPPFGEIYIWLFKHFPGFMMFRDPTKWYTLIAISYSVLIPLSIWRIYEWLRKENKFSTKNKIFNFQNLFLLSVICYLLILVRPAILGQLNGTFKTTRVPEEYVKLKDFLYNQPQFFRTLWVPITQRFSFNSDNHPAISGQGILEVADTPKVGMQLFKPNSEQLIQEAGVKYIIVPYDSEAEIFLKDRKYDEEQYKKTVNKLKTVKWLKPLDEKFGKIVLFEVPNTRDHFFLVPRAHDLRSKINYQMINPTKYLVNLEKMKKGTTLVFSESYDVGWKAKVVNDSSVKKIATVSYGGLAMTNRLNSFVLPENGSYTLEVIYEPQKWVNVGLIVAIGTFILCILFFAYIFIESNICRERKFR